MGYVQGELNRGVQDRLSGITRRINRQEARIAALERALRRISDPYDSDSPDELAKIAAAALKST